LLTLIDPLREKCIQRVFRRGKQSKTAFITSAFMTAAVNEALYKFIFTLKI